jgi:hypothetical protein
VTLIVIRLVLGARGRQDRWKVVLVLECGLSENEFTAPLSINQITEIQRIFNKCEFMLSKGSLEQHKRESKLHLVRGDRLLIDDIVENI